MVTSPRRTARNKPPALPANRATRRSKQAAVLVAVGLVAAGILATMLLTDNGENPVSTQHIIPANRARTYSQVSDCLLTDPAGVQSSLAAAVWDGMQAASAATHTQVSYLAIQGPNTVANAEVYINTLAMRGCSVVVAAGDVPAQGAVARASAWPHQRLVTITTTALARPTARPGNLTSISSTSTASVTGQIKALLTVGSSTTIPTA